MGQNLTKVHYNSTIIYFSRILAHFSPALIIVHYNPRENFATCGVTLVHEFGSQIVELVQVR